ncbi:hypothetical protein [Paraliomyxa miuraensis]|uniref:hypothetical protein n=1 Tax=Paraliomyxa miuraensis TaxID=376150 RepID=UPI00224D71E0|nr:hypothetical protein [Paraliomyxa miuraensis]MCX4243658.1 hypothetical protein [Paraliomyxa miuraensis]
MMLLGNLGAGQQIGSCDPDVIGARAMMLAPSLGEIRASAQGGTVSLEVEAPSGATGMMVLEREGDQLVTSTNARHLPEALATALVQLGPALSSDPVVLAELAGCEQDERTPKEVLEARERTRPDAIGQEREPRVPWVLPSILVLGALIAAWMVRARPTDRPAPPRLPLPRLGWASVLPITLGAMLVSSLYLAISADGLPIRHDSIRDLATARDLWVDGIGPGTHGSSVPGVQHGRLWPAILGFLRFAGADLRWIHGLRDASIVGATVLCTLLAVRLHGPRSAWAAAVAAGILGPWFAVHPLLWNPALATLPLAGLFVLLSLQLERGGPRLAVITGTVAGIAMQAHPINAFAIPLVAAVATVRGGSFLDPLLAVAAALVTVSIVDPQWILNWRSLATAGPIATVVTACVPIAIVLGGLVRGRFDRLPAASRQHVLIYATSLGLAAVIAVASYFAELPRRHYLAAVVPGMACFAGLVGARVRGRSAGARRDVAVWLAACALAIAPGPGPFAGHGYYLEDVERLAGHLHARGISRAQAAMVLQTPHRFAQVVALPLLYPDPSPERASVDPARPVLAFFPREGVVGTPAGWERVRLAYTDALLGTGPLPWADRREFETCGQRNGAPWCRSVIDAGVTDPASPWLQRTRNMDLSSWPGEIDPSSVVQRITMRASEAGTRYLILDPAWELSGCVHFECTATGHPAVVELSSTGKVEGELVLRQREHETPMAILGLAVELDHPPEAWLTDSLPR